MNGTTSSQTAGTKRKLLTLVIGLLFTLLLSGASFAASLEKTSLTVKTGNSVTLKLRGNKNKVSWSVSDGKIVSLSKRTKTSVKITGRKVGSATVRVTISGTKETLSCTVTVKKKARIAVVDVASLNPYGNAGSVAAALRRCGASASVVRSAGFSVSSYDGLVIPGGIDVSPSTYHEKRQPRCERSNARLDKIQLQAIDKFVRAKKPVLGICRGHQILNVYFGGSLKQHIGGHRGGSHVLTTQPGSFVHALFGASMSVPTSHHQAVNRLGSNLKITQRVRKDNQVEAIEHLSLPVYGVQWHPELSGSRGTKLFKAFIAKCEEG